MITKFKIFNESILEIPQIPNTQNYWHGGNLDEFDDIISQKNGRYEWDMGYGINNAVVYECLIPIVYIKPDLDQLRNVRHFGEIEVGNTIGDSIVYGHGVRVKGDIPPYMIKKFS